MDSETGTGEESGIDVEDTGIDSELGGEAHKEGEGKESLESLLERTFNEVEGEAKEEKDSDEQSGTVAESVEEKDSEQEVEEPPVKVVSKKDSAPSRFNAEEKEAYNKLPKRMKEAVLRMVKSHEAQFTRGQQEIVRARQEAEKVRDEGREILTMVRAHYLGNENVPGLSHSGLTESQVVGKLLATHRELTQSNVEARLATWLDVGRNCGFGQIVDSITEKANMRPQTPNLGEAPEFKTLRDEITELKSFINENKSRQMETTVSSITQELDALANEKDMHGRYLWPEMHDERIEEAKPLVSALKQALPNLSYTEAFKRTLRAMRDDRGGSLGTHAKLPQNGNNTQRALAAGGSVRGGRLVKNPQSIPQDKITKDPMETLKHFYEMYED